jgi:hypothetical protein
VSKFSIVYVKQHPVMFGAIFLVFGLFLWMMLNRGTSGGSVSTTVTTPQPSDAAIAAGVQLQMGQLEASTQVAMGQLSLAANQQNNQAQSDLAAMALQAQVLQIQSDHDLANSQIEASLGALALQLGNNLAITHDNNQFMIDYAKNAQDSATDQLLIGANLQAELSKDQLKAFTTSSLLSVIPTLKKKDRDETLQIIGSQILGNPVNFANGPGAARVSSPGVPIPAASSGGGGLFSAIGSVISPVGSLLLH